MFDHDNRVTQCLQLAEHLYQQIGIARMEPDTRLIQYIQGTDQATAQRSRQINTLAFTTGERGGKTVERQVTQSYIQQELQAVGDFRQQAAGNGSFVLVEL